MLIVLEMDDTPQLTPGSFIAFSSSHNGMHIHVLCFVISMNRRQHVNLNPLVDTTSFPQTRNAVKVPYKTGFFYVKRC